MITEPRAMFQLDAAGATVSVLLLGVVLPFLQPHIGVPVTVLYGLSLWAGACLLYDLFCLRLVPLTQPRWLSGIVLANALYCILSAGLIVAHIDALTTLGVAYFLLEILVLVAVVAVEIRLVLRLRAVQAAANPTDA